MLIYLWPLECTSWQKGSSHLISLVDSIDKLRTRGTPGKTHRGGVDSLALYISWWHSGHWSRETERRWVRVGGRKGDGSEEIREEKAWKCTTSTFRPASFIAWESGRSFFFSFYFLFWLIWGGKNTPIKLGVRAVASGSFQVNPAAVCLKWARDSDVTPENSRGVTLMKRIGQYWPHILAKLSSILSQHIQMHMMIYNCAFHGVNDRNIQLMWAELNNMNASFTVIIH